MKVIVTGATGMVGKGVLLECLDHGDVERGYPKRILDPRDMNALAVG